MKAFTILLVSGLAALSAAQAPTYSSRRPSQPPTNQQTSSQSAQAGTRSGSNTQSAALVPTEVIRVLSSSSVQQDLSITDEELSELRQIARNLVASTTSEDDAFSSVSRVLSAAQVAKLQQFMIQDLGYGALALSSVRSKLSLTQDQTSQITALVAIQEAAKRAILTQSSNAAEAVKSVSEIADLTNASLAKILTSTQDATLRKLAA